MLFIADGVFNDRAEIGDIQRIAPDKAESFLKIMGMGLIEAYGLRQAVVAHTDITLQLTVAGHEGRSGIMRYFGVNIIRQDVFPEFRPIPCLLRKSPNSDPNHQTRQ
jgi:hypothetical protein